MAALTKVDNELVDGNIDLALATAVLSSAVVDDEADFTAMSSDSVVISTVTEVAVTEVNTELVHGNADLATKLDNEVVDGALSTA